ncbi:hypothetical protein NLM24_41215 [Nocardia zapadnayensis]|nr:hypothetical protein [Nocardia zapadnayensis]MCX0276931.1 hypothetical protein [Nocardia zapadnayensis]
MNRILVALGLLLALLGGAGCGLIDTRPKSTYAEFVQAASALAGVDSVIATGSSEFQLTLDTGAQEAELADTSQALFDLVNGHRYPDGAPTLSVESGVFTGEIGVIRRGAGPGVPQPGPLALEHLPFLHALPAVEEGTLGDGSGASVRLQEGTDMRTWTSDAAAAPRELRLSAHRPMTDDEIRVLPPDDREAAETTDGAAEPDQHSAEPEPPDVSIDLDLSRPDLPADLVRLHDTVESVSATLIDADLSSIDTAPDTALAVPADSDIPAVLAAFEAEYGPDRLDDVRVASAEGLSVGGGEGDVDAFFEARGLLEATGAEVRSMDLRRDSLTARMPDGDTLRDVSAAVSGSDWPLSADTRLSVEHTSHPDDSPYFTAGSWPAHADLLAALWDAGFDSVRMSAGNQLSDFDLRLYRTETQDLTSADSRAALIDVLRTTGWDGRAQISLATGDHLIFWSAADGAAEEPYMALHGADREPTGWAADFLAEWDATAG